MLNHEEMEVLPLGNNEIVYDCDIRNTLIYIYGENVSIRECTLFQCLIVVDSRVSPAEIRHCTIHDTQIVLDSPDRQQYSFK
jgi:hypothetical protein